VCVCELASVVVGAMKPLQNLYATINLLVGLIYHITVALIS